MKTTMLSPHVTALTALLAVTAAIALTATGPAQVADLATDSTTSAIHAKTRWLSGGIDLSATRLPGAGLRHNPAAPSTDCLESLIP